MTHKRDTTWAKPLLLIALLALGLAVLIVLRSIPALSRAVREAREAQLLLERVAATWEEERLSGLPSMDADLAQAERLLARAGERIDSEAFLRFLPGVRGTIDAAERATTGAAAIASGARALTAEAVAVGALVARFRDRSYRDLTDAERAAVVMEVGSGVLRIRAASAAFSRGTALLADVRCPWIARRIVPACDLLETYALPRELDAALRSVHAIAAATDRLAASFASDTPTDVLLLFLNNTELRPGGGFLGTYGLLTVAGGRVTAFTTDDVYALDVRAEGLPPIAPPAPFRDLGIVRAWYLRDANWSPDFAVASETVLEFYEREGGPGNPTIVVGFTPTFAAQLLALVGPVTVAGVTFDAANIADELEYQVEQAYAIRGIPQHQRKDIIAPLSRAVIEGFLALPFRTWLDGADRVRSAVAERQLMAYSSDRALEGLIERIGLAGRVRTRAAGEDALLVVDANLGALKTDAVMERAVTYAIAPDATGGYVGRVTLRYRNTGTFTWKTTRYQTYTRVYLPPGTTFLGVRGSRPLGRTPAGSVDAYDELDRTAFGFFWVTEPGREETLELTVRIAPDVAARIRSGSYALTVQKQLGLPEPAALTVDHNFGTLVGAAEPPEIPAAAGDAQYVAETDLRVDRTFAVTLERE